MVSNSGMATTTSCIDSRQLSIAPHQFEKAERVPHGMNLAHLISVNCRDWDGFDPVTFAAGDYEHFSFVIESMAATKQLGNQLPM
jgi:hypothetical protein